MSREILDELSSFTADTGFDDLPPIVLSETVRIVLDSIGCAFAGTTHRRGTIAVNHARMQGGKTEATIIGTSDKVSISGAAFANAELINALDYDAVLPPGHVTPYVLPGALATAESLGAGGRELIVATAIAHEISYRIGKAMDYLRDIKDGKVQPPSVWGFASSIFGATTAISKIQKQPKNVLQNALSIAAIISPVNSAAAWRQHAPATTIKYLLGGWLAQGALTATQMAALGHRGDPDIFDPEFGYPRFIGTRRWEPEHIVRNLGREWLFTRELSFKPYPHCRILHAPLDALGQLVDENELKPDEIDGITAWVEGFVERPIWMNRSIADVTDAQFSIAHGMALAAHRLPAGPEWQNPENVYAPSVMRLMTKVDHVVHPDYENSLTADRASRPTRVEVRARGQVFATERSHPRGSGQPGSDSYMTTPELIEKFRVNAKGVISDVQTDELVNSLIGLEKIDDVGKVMQLASRR